MKKYFSILLSVMVIIAFFVFILSKNNTKIEVTPENSLLDEPIEIVISNLPPSSQITLEASLQSNDAWISRAIFQANNKGVVNVAKQAPISGFYSGINPMGLFWSMKPTIKDSTLVTLNSVNLTPFKLSVFLNTKLLTQKTIYRSYIAPNIEKKEIREQGVVGLLFYPKNKKSPGVIIIPGSSGRLPGYICQILASHGYAVLELKYFGEDGLPENMSLISLEYFKNAIQWLKKQSQVDENKIALMGQSTGGELALLIASTFPGEMNAVIALSAPSFALGSWTYKNKPIPHVSLNHEEQLEIKGTIENPFQKLRQICLSTMESRTFKKLIKEAVIPVEKICCPLLILSGDEDALWPSSQFGKDIMKRLDAYGSTIKRKFINYLNAGNNLLLIPTAPSIDLPFQLTNGAWCIHGGSTEGNAKTHQEVWLEILNFLKKTNIITPALPLPHNQNNKNSVLVIMGK